jgi:methyl-galactoside transport system substrate-binding protein
VICNNDAMAEGAISALNASGFNKGGDGARIPVFGVDATEAAKALIKDGKMAGTVMQDATGMAKALSRLAINALADQDLLTDTADLTIDENVRKVRISYAKYLG